MLPANLIIFDAMRKNEPIIRVKNVYKHFKHVKAVDGIDLEIKKGEFVALLGPNGAGKTTLVEMIEGIQKPDAGEITLKGLNWDKNQEELHRTIGLSLQETRFFEKITVHETLRLFASFYKLDDSRISEVLDLINLEEKKKAYVVNLSGGQRQRLALGISIINNPEILLLDEPTTGLDPTARREVWDILNMLRKELSTTLILTTHYMEEAAYLCERIVIMDSGKILAQGTLNQLLSQYVKGEIINFSLKEPFDESLLPQKSKVQKIVKNEEDHEVEIVVEDLVSYLPVFLNSIREKGLNLSSLECRKMTLDDLFISMTGKRLND